MKTRPLWYKSKLRIVSNFSYHPMNVLILVHHGYYNLYGIVVARIFCSCKF